MNPFSRIFMPQIVCGRGSLAFVKTLGKKKAAEILADAQKKADAVAAAQQEKSDAAVARLRAQAAARRDAAVEETVRRLLELS